MRKYISILSIALILSLTSCKNTNTISNIESTLEENSIEIELVEDNQKVSTEASKENLNIIEKEVEIIVEEPKTYKVNIKMVGDNLIHSTLYKQALNENGVYNFNFMFEHLKEDIENADLAIINQETIFINDRNKVSSYPMFGSPTEVGDAIVSAGFDIVAHATNHTLDKNIQGIEDTITFWEEKYPGTIYLGIHDSKEDSDIAYVEKNNIKFAFVNYTYGLNGLEPWREGKEHMVDLLSDNDIEDTLAEAEQNADLTIAILHVGNEYVYKPTEYQQEQIDKFIDNGADIVLCAHPHVLQPYEERTTASGNKGVVYYSLGNYISSQDEVPRVLGGMADIVITKTEFNGASTIEIESFNLIPLVTHQEKGNYTTYRLDEYTEELANRHRLKNKGLSIEHLNNLYNEILNFER